MPEIGALLEDLDTPCLALDGPAAQRNLERMAAFFRGRACRLRPHFKNHKCVGLARWQAAAGALVGFTCAKLGEAEVLADHGFRDLLIANQVVGRRKIARLVALAARADVKVAVDHEDQVEAISRAAAGAGATIGVLVEVDIGMGRCGVPPGEPALRLARTVTGRPGLRFDGLQAYEGHAVYVDDAAERARRARRSLELAIETRRLIEREGIAVRVLSGGSSATYATAGSIEGVDEVQAGTYATMDWRYAQLAPEFEVALSVVARVISRRGETAVLDVGLKGLAAEFGPPRVKGFPQVEIPRLCSEEHCVATRVPETWRIGDAVEIVPSHACTTCNLYREMVVHDAGRIEYVWPIEGSGRLA